MTSAKKRPFRSSKGLARSTVMREAKSKVYIVCEGQTEDGYFIHLARLLKLTSVSVDERPDHYGAASGVVRRAIELKKELEKPTDSVWAVFDTEVLDNNKDFFKAVRVAKEKDLNCVITNPCMEYWLLLHYRHTDRAFADCAEATKQLRLQPQMKNYEKGRTATKHLYLSQIREAAWRAEEFCQNIETDEKFRQTSSEVYKLVNFLIELSQG